MKTFKEFVEVAQDINLVEHTFKYHLFKAIKAEERGDVKMREYPLDNAKTARYSIPTSEYPKHKEHFAKYKQMRDGTLSEARMPLKGHPYHDKSDAELHGIIKDAGETARVQKGMSSEGKYLDQVNDASTVLHYRKSLKK
jgi:hypothetical protein